MNRVFVSLAILVLIFTAPAYIYIPALFIAVIYHSFYWEGIILALLISALFGSSEGGLFIRNLLAVIISILILILIPLKERIRIN